ncbi:hypothetical protein JTB14_027193 [Gonioctena quinquepunctata]|nr:hypothetical protein JTB14_027193 [Gonioctena quinquepunctata]
MVGFSYALHGKVFIAPVNGKLLVVRAIELAKNFVLIISSIVVTIQLVFMYPNNLKRLLNALGDVDRKMRLPEKLKKKFWIGFNLNNITILAYLIMKISFWSSNTLYRYYYSEDFSIYQANIGIFLYFWLAVEILHRFQVLNDSLKNFGQDLYDTKILSEVYQLEILSVGAYSVRYLQQLSGLYECLIHVLDILNESFGLFAMFYVLTNVTFIMEQLITLAWSMSFPSATLNLVEYANLPWICCFSIFGAAVRIFAIAAVGTYLLKEANNTIAICYNTIHALEPDSSHEAEILKEELRHFVNQIAHRQPRLSAAGFFNVDFSMMGFIVSSITSYIIVAIQFLKVE